MKLFGRLEKIDYELDSKWNDISVEGKEKLEKLTMGEIMCVDLITKCKNPTVLELANHLNISQPNATYRINKLCNKNIIYKKTNEVDRRITNLYIKEDYKDTLDKLDVEYEKLSKEIEIKLEDNFSKEEIENACKVLDFIINQLEER